MCAYILAVWVNDVDEVQFESNSDEWYIVLFGQHLLSVHPWHRDYYILIAAVADGPHEP